MLPLKTERLLLRDFVRGDFADFYAATQDEAYRQFYAESELAQPFWERIFERILASASAEPRRSYQLAVCLPEGTLIGTCGVRTEDIEHMQASYGCAIRREYWGQGLALEASRHLITFCFSHLPLHRIYAETNSENIRARRLAEKLGMRLEGELHQNRFFRGRWWNTVIYAVVEQEWAEASGSFADHDRK